MEDPKEPVHPETDDKFVQEAGGVVVVEEPEE